MGLGWGDFVAAVIAAGVVSGLVSRLCLWLAAGLGPTRRRLVAAHAVTLLVMVTGASLLLGFGRGANLPLGLLVCAPPQLVWLVWDIGALRRRG